MTGRLAAGTSLKVEVAQSSGAGDGMLSSIDGGFGFNSQKGSTGDAMAKRVELQANLAELKEGAEGRVSAYWQDREEGFSGPGQIAYNGEASRQVGVQAEVTVGKDNKLKVDRVVCAVECGLAVNPDVIRAQMEGGIGFGLTAALYGKITLKDGVVEQSNFHDYPVIRVAEMPLVEVHIVASSANPSGIGEPAVPPLAPAVANAIAAATGKRLRSLPIASGLLKA